MGHPHPRIGPPVPARSDWKLLRETASGMGIDFMPWQDTAARFLAARGPDGRLLFREVAIVVARQNGKTTLMKPLIVQGLRAGERILHVAQNRELPRHMFGLIADALSNEPELFPKRRGRTIWPRYGAGQEEIALENGGWYRIAAASRGGGRGWAADKVIIDELREMDDPEVIGMVEPTLMMSADPQLIELSNAGHENSVVLNAVRERAGKDPSLAYLEWSAAPERDPGDVEGWAEANPALGHFPSVMRSLEASYRKHKLGGTMATFETENLCRWVNTLRPNLIELSTWSEREVPDVGEPRNAYLGVAMDPAGTRASAALAWRLADEAIALRVLYDVPGSPIDTDALGKDLRAELPRQRVLSVGYGPDTDRELVKFFPKAEPIGGAVFANATSRFVLVSESGKLRHSDAGAVTDDLAWTTRKRHDETGKFEAARADDERPITAVLAAIRAVWLASGPTATPARIW